MRFVTSIATVASLALALSFALTASARAQTLFLSSGSYEANDTTYQSGTIRVGMDSSSSKTDGIGNPYVATLNVVTGGDVFVAYVYNSNSANVSGGGVLHLFTYDTGSANVSGGEVYDARSYNTSTYNITGGTVLTLAVNDASTANISGGDMNSVGSTGTTNISGGSVGNLYNSDGTANMSGGNVANLYGFGASAINLSGGTVAESANLVDTSILNISGGSISDIFASNDTTINISGGTIGTDTIRLFENGIVKLFGTGLSFSSGVPGSDDSGPFMQYTLSGTLAGGQSINGVTVLDYNNGLSVENPHAGTGNLRFFSPAAIGAPEPGTLALFGLGIGLVWFGTRRRKR